jgi:hypothetical protein
VASRILPTAAVAPRWKCRRFGPALGIGRRWHAWIRHSADDRTLTAPDFIGNFFFNTMGNLQVNPRAGLLFLDFSTGDVLMLPPG